MLRGQYISKSLLADRTCICFLSRLLIGWPGLRCHLEDACESNPCYASAGCETSPIDGNPICTCQKGWRGADCSIDINECQESEYFGFLCVYLWLLTVLKILWPFVDIYGLLYYVSVPVECQNVTVSWYLNVYMMITLSTCSISWYLNICVMMVPSTGSDYRLVFVYIIVAPTIGSEYLDV